MLEKKDLEEKPWVRSVEGTFLKPRRSSREKSRLRTRGGRCGSFVKLQNKDPFNVWLALCCPHVAILHRITILS